MNLSDNNNTGSFYQEAKQLIKVAIIEDDDSYRKVLKEILLSDKRIRLYGEYSRCSDFLNILNSTFYPDVCMIDIVLPDLKGTKCAEKIKEINPDIHVIIMTAYPNAQTLAEAKNLAADYIEKGTRGEVLINKIIVSRTSKSAGEFISINQANIGVDKRILELAKDIAEIEKKIADLSETQRKVMKLKKAGKSVKEIAALLEMTPSTVHTHLERAAAKVNLPDILKYINV